MNRVFLSGRLTRDPETRYTKENKPVSRFTLAVDRGYGGKKTTDFISCVAFDMKADYVGKKWKKGDFMVIEGNIKTGSYEGKNGKVKTADVIVEQIVNYPSKETYGTEPAPANAFEDLADDDGELPF